ncbi:MAG: hypothetical protein HRT38_09645 [Alteromonadaceae bacterium]|nr:hypothetical protein [Alteromonadaceae bacterium]
MVLNTAQALLAHIALKTTLLTLFGVKIRVQQWTATERLQYLEMISTCEGTDEVSLLRPQAKVVGASMVDDHGDLLFTTDEQIESLVQNRPTETSEAFVTICQFNGVSFNCTDSETGANTDDGTDEEKDSEEVAAKN